MSFGIYADSTPETRLQTWTVPFLNEQAALNAKTQVDARAETLESHIFQEEDLWKLTWRETVP